MNEMKLKALQELKDALKKSNENVERDFQVNRLKAQVTIVTSKGMRRGIKFYTQIDEDVTKLIAILIDENMPKSYKGGLSIGGCGMDMIFESLYRLNRESAKLDKVDLKQNPRCGYNYLVSTYYDYI